MPGEWHDALGEPRVALGFGGVAGRPRERGGRGSGVSRVDEHASPRVGGVGRVGRVAPSPQVDAQAQVVDDPPGKQAHQVRVSRQPGVHARPGTLRHSGAPDVVEALEHDDLLTGAGEVRGGDERIVPSSDDHDIVSVLRHPSTLMRAGVE